MSIIGGKQGDPVHIRNTRGDEFNGHEIDDTGMLVSGILTYANGDTFIGELNSGERDGEGEMKFANGDVYYGNFEHDKKNGLGTMGYANGDVYLGDWKDDKKHGEGMLKYANGRIFKGIWVNDQIYTDPIENSPSPLSIESMQDNFPSKVIDVENDNYDLNLSSIDGNQPDIPMVFLAGKDLFVFTKKRIAKALKDKTSIVYKCNEDGSRETDMPYFNIRKLFHTILDGLVPLRLLIKTLTQSNKKTAVRERFHSVANKINQSYLTFSAKKKSIMELLKDNKLPPVMYKFVPTTKPKIDRLVSKAFVEGVPNAAIGGFHCQDQGGMKWTIYSMVQVVNHRRRRKSVHKKTRSTRSSRSARSSRSVNTI